MLDKAAMPFSNGHSQPSRWWLLPLPMRDCRSSRSLVDVRAQSQSDFRSVWDPGPCFGRLIHKDRTPVTLDQTQEIANAVCCVGQAHGVPFVSLQRRSFSLFDGPGPIEFFLSPARKLWCPCVVSGRRNEREPSRPGSSPPMWSACLLWVTSGDPAPSAS
jgi:hypothetical protein